jgi:hypothetical protein
MHEFLDIDEKLYAWKALLRLRREQLDAQRRAQQPTLFTVD